MNDKINSIYLICLSLALFSCIHIEESLSKTLDNKYLDAYYLAGTHQDKKAIEEFKQLLRRDKGNFLIYRILTELYIRQGDLDTGINFFSEKESIQHPYSLWAAGKLYQAKGNIKLAIQTYRKAVNLNNQFPDIFIGLIDSYLLGDEQNISSFFDLKNFLLNLRNNENPAAHFATGYLYFRQFEFDTALEYFYTAKSILRQNTYMANQILAKIYNIEAEIYFSIADYEQSLDALEKTIEYETKIGDLKMVSQLLNNTGLVYGQLSQHLQSIDYFNQALKLTKQIGYADFLGGIYNNLGQTYGKMGQYDEAVKYLKLSVKACESSNFVRAKADALNNLGIVSSLLKEHQSALDYYKEAMDLKKSLNDVRGLAQVHLNMAKVYYQTSHYEQALEQLEKAQVILENIKDYYGICKNLTHLGKVLLAQNNPESAFLALKKAADLAETIRSSMNYDQFKNGFFQEQNDLYENMVRCLFQLSKTEQGKTYKELAFTYSERYKARGLQDLLTESNENVQKGIDPGLLSQERELAEEYSRVNTELIYQPNEPLDRINREKISELKKNMEELDKKLFRLKEKIARANPRYADLKYPEPVTLSRIQKNYLDKESLLIEYMIAEDVVYAWAISKDNIDFYSLEVSSAKLEEDVFALRNCLLTVEQEDVFIPRASRIYKSIVEPILTSQRYFKKLVIVPDGILNYLPFEILLTEEPKTELSYHDQPYLIRDYIIQYAPSAGVAFRLSDKKRAPTSHELLAIGDPVFFDPQSLSERLFHFRDQPQNRFRPKMERLIFSGEEVKNISSLFSQTEIKLQDSAKEEVIKSTALANYKYIHLATHGFMNEDVPLTSGLAFAQDNDPSEDGILYTWEIFNLQLNADLVVLSACNTGLGKVINGEGMIGFSRAWFYAGASNLLVSLWSINDLATSILMVNFYKNVIQGFSYAEALQKTKLSLLKENQNADENDFSNPFFWAGFILTGGG